MRTPNGSLLLLYLGAFLTAASAASAKPIRHPHYPVAVPSNQQQQLVQPATLRQYSPPHQAAQSQRRDQPHHPHQPGRHSSGHLDAAPNSVGLLLTTANHNDDDAAEVLHVWLPLGRRVYTRDDPYLPLHPVTSRVTTMIRSTPRIATPEHLENILCRIYPHYNLTAEEVDGSRVVEGHGPLEVRRRDGLVHLADLGGRPWREVEAYECS
ncbi:hypothetical protein LTS16_019574 [Friedmanniomyces endolithicus]|nr:hypothetical protein LTR94_015542 [Friedmanniomyces endolithicus]KAK0787085.1 hypothetical protein LTR75_013024 [Friedmanniomyces endolithicus]KAK0804547.1 hypothetical protein LTR59_004293 [Friedmanniomyces endolithicus]KAK0816839.1 hypothetical protein LTR38_001869 [Friedmanniomyces endolithicus]KAK0852203.1 hypothetical protein LTS02_012495 [Friedmanniomyces endolithicus]